MRNPLRTLPSVIDWLRIGYPDDAPRTGYSPLLALNGPIGLSESKIQAIVRELRTGPCDKTDIAVAITRVTGQLPDASQVRHVSDAIRRWR